jgi:dipeptidyl aminopeptidase/acylaminoacyl peptidase
VQIRSSLDGSVQPALFDAPVQTKPIPLLVHLHSWSSDYKNSNLMEEAEAGARALGWAILSPNFRGPNDKPSACASELAVQDVIDAVRYAQKNARIDRRRIYLLGRSGGGHMALVMAARHPKVWAAVSAWVPISDLAAWHASTKAAKLRYPDMLEQCCGGAPGTPAADVEYRKRSPLFHLAKAKGLPLSIHAGIHDGHKGASVPVSQSLLAFNELAKANGEPGQVFTLSEIESMVAEGQRIDTCVD